uniref:Uncharacterized protein n=1 Tax=uncultured alpha proteobacterium HF0070_14E07 TaxID=710804 RepID=E0XS43_9PROT|nr:hypothetical protein [uncultured alpha proteobacterium HF0070_14E07]
MTDCRHVIIPPSNIFLQNCHLLLLFEASFEVLILFHRRPRDLSSSCK